LHEKILCIDEDMSILIAFSGPCQAKNTFASNISTTHLQKEPQKDAGIKKNRLSV
jgi:hypothetical protein